MDDSLPLDKRTRGFTLIELLTVIAIIAILMSLLMPALNAAKNSARKAEARSDMTALVNAVYAYHTDYGLYPLNSLNGAAGGYQSDTCYGDPGGLYSSADLCDILRAIPDARYNINNQLNVRQVIYFEGSIAKNANAPLGGFVMNPAGVTGPTGKAIPYGGYVDPWGMEYVVFIDANYDGTLSQITPAMSAAGVTYSAMQWFYVAPLPVVNAGAAAVSLGPDRSWGTASNGIFQGSDDIATWQ